MKLGKLSEEQLNKLIFAKIKPRRKETLVASGIGEDCAALDLNGECCVLSTDPITAADANVGSLAVHVSVNDVASAGAEPVALLATILLPPECSEKELTELSEQLAQTAAQLDVDIVGGHTEVTDAVNRIVVSTTVIGKVSREGMIPTSGAQAGDELVLAGVAGIEGTAILASDFSEQLQKVLSEQELCQAKAMKEQLSVLAPARIAKQHGAHSMHDVTEGGVFGAVYEMAAAAGLGARIRVEDIPLLPVTQKICRCFQIDPYRLISSGALLIALPDGEKLMEEFRAKGIPAARIGTMTQAGIYASQDGTDREIAPPETDELYRAFKNVTKD